MALRTGAFPFDRLTVNGGSHHNNNNNNRSNRRTDGLSISNGNNNNDCKSPYAACDDSDDDGASSYADHPQSRRQKQQQQQRRNQHYFSDDHLALTPESREDGNHHSDTLLQRFYDTVDAPCQLACQRTSLEDQLDLLTHCRQPMAFLSFFREHHSEDSVGVEVMPAGAYVLPSFCEYCQAAHTSQCVPGRCARPKLYFQKKRPPFCKPDPAIWDTTTDHYKDPALAKAAVSPDTSQRQSSWLSMFSTSDGGD